jgi:hypothetical protein
MREMVEMRKLAVAAIAFLLAGAGTVVSAPDAHALGTVHRQCTHYNTATGNSTSGAGGFTTNAGVCDQAKVRLMYRTYNGSPSYYTGWTYASSTAIRHHPGNIVIGGNHGVADPALAFLSARDFNS